MFSIAAHGHVNPSLEVIRELVARGHRVSYGIPASFAEKIAATGAEPVIYTSTLPMDDDPDAWGPELVDNLEPFLTDGTQALPQLAEAFENDRPDLVISDITSYPAPIRPTGGACRISSSHRTWSPGRGTTTRSALLRTPCSPSRSGAAPTSPASRPGWTRTAWTCPWTGSSPIRTARSC